MDLCKYLRLFVFLVLCHLLVLTTTLSQAKYWHQRTSAVGFNVGINPLNPYTIYCERTGGVLSVSRDKGKHWTDLPTSPGISGIRNIIVHPRDTLTIFVCEFFNNGLKRTTNEGATWSTVIPSYGIDGESVDYDPVHSDTMYAGKFSDGAVYRSTDRGATWTLQGFSGPNLCGLSVRPDSANILYAGTGASRISKSTDEGVTWRIVNDGGTEEVPKFAINPIHPLIGYATTYGEPDSIDFLWKTTDGGETWFKTGLQKLGIWSLAMDVQHPETLYVGRFGETRGVDRTTDGGVTFEHFENGLLTNFAAWNLRVHPLAPQDVWVAGTENFFGAGGIFQLFDSASGIVSSEIDNGWNMVSLPVVPADNHTSALFPDAVSSAFKYTNSYVIVDTLHHGIGYWLRFSGSDTIVISGDPVIHDTIPVRKGWNMIGSLAIPIRVNSITSIPGGIVTSQAFGYNGAYYITDSIKLGKAYWIKVNQAGQLILDQTASNIANQITIVATAETPPPFPATVNSEVSDKPTNYELEQSYPNPFNSTSVIRYQLPVAGQVSLKVYNLVGEVVAVLQNRYEESGYKSLSWNADKMPSGLYFYKLEVTSPDAPNKTFTQVRKMVLLK